MSEKRTEITPQVEQVLAPYWEKVDPLIESIQEDLHRREKYPMQISREQVRFHAWLCRLIGVRRVLEVGTYLGVSAAGFAHALPADGHVDTVEISPEHADIAEDWFRKGGLADRITVHRGPALELVPGLRGPVRSEEHTSELQSRGHLVCRLLLEKREDNSSSKSCEKGSLGTSPR